MYQSLELFNDPPNPIQIQLYEWHSHLNGHLTPIPNLNRQLVSNSNVTLKIQCLRDKLCYYFVCNKCTGNGQVQSVPTNLIQSTRQTFNKWTNPLAEGMIIETKSRWRFKLIGDYNYSHTNNQPSFVEYLKRISAAVQELILALNSFKMTDFFCFHVRSSK